MSPSFAPLSWWQVTAEVGVPFHLGVLGRRYDEVVEDILSGCSK